MGGFGSGRKHYPTKTTVENCHKVDANNFAKWQYFQPGVRSGIVRWSQGVSCGVHTNIDDKPASCVFEYNGREVRVHLSWYRPGYGGRRYLFLCPQCRRRMRTLFFKGCEIACRICHGLTYKSCNKSDHLDGLCKYMALAMKVPVKEAKQALAMMGLAGKRERMRRPRGRPRKY
jgi:hypothetical protein